MLNILKKIKVTLIYMFIAFSFVGLFHYNIVMVYFAQEAEYHSAKKPWIRRYKEIFGESIEFHRKVGMGTLWRMYVSGRRTTSWIEWQAQKPDGTWHLYETANSSPHHRKTRSWSEALFFDFKVAIMQMSLLSTDKVRVKYGKYLHQTAKENLGWRPIAVRPVRHTHPKLTPQEKGDFSLLTSPVKSIREYPSISREKGLSDD